MFSNYIGPIAMAAKPVLHVVNSPKSLVHQTFQPSGLRFFRSWDRREPRCRGGHECCGRESAVSRCSRWNDRFRDGLNPGKSSWVASWDWWRNLSRTATGKSSWVAGWDRWGDPSRAATGKSSRVARRNRRRNVNLATILCGHASRDSCSGGSKYLAWSIFWFFAVTCWSDTSNMANGI